MCLQPSILCFCASLSFLWLPIARVKMLCALPCPGRHRHPRMLVLLMVLVMTSMEWAPAPEILWMKSSMPSFTVCAIQGAHGDPYSHDLDVPYGFTYHEHTW